MPEISVQLLQTPVIRLDGSVITFFLKKSDALFFYMCIEKTATRTRLASLLWGGQPEATARKNLRNALYAIKQSFGFDPFESPKKQIINLSSQITFTIDTDRFQETGDLKYYQGEFLSGFALKDSYEFDEWMNSVRTRFTDLYLQQISRGFREISPDNVAGREDLFHRYIAVDPLDERIYLQMIRTYQENGQLLKGIRCYEELDSRLKDELGIAPSREAKLLYREMEQTWKYSGEPVSAGRSEELLIGREREYAVLRKAWKMLQLRQGSTIFLSGEKGIGKTWLADYFLQSLPAGASLVLRADCTELEKALPLQPWNHLFVQLQHFLQTTPLKIPQRCMETIETCFPVLETLQHLDAQPQEIAASYNYRAVRNAVLQLFSLIGENIPVVLCINDLTNMDPQSADWLSTLIRQNRGDYFVLITCPESMGALWEKYVGDLVCLKGVQKVVLHPFSPEDIRTYLLRKLPENSVTEPLLDSVVRESRGNPFFLDIITTDLSDAPEQKQASRAEDILRTRLASLSREERRLLDLVSLFLDGTTADPLCFITGIDVLDLVDLLDLLVDKEFLTEETQGNAVWFRFRHQRMQEFVRKQLSPSKKHLYHRRIAEYLEQYVRPRDSRWYSLLIYHFRECGSPAKSLYYRILQMEAFSNLNYDLYPVLTTPIEGTEDSHRDVLEQLQELERELSRYYTLYPNEISYKEACARLDLTIARICIQQGDYRGGLQVIHRQLADSQYLLSNPQLHRAYQRQRIFYGIQTWNTDVMQDALRICLEIDLRTSEIQELAVDHRLQALYYNMIGDYPESNNILNIAIEEFQSSPLALQLYTVNLAACYNYLGENARKQQQYEKAIRNFNRALSMCRENDQMENPTFYVNLGRTYLSLRDYEAAENVLHSARMLFESSNVQMCRSLCYICQALAEYMSGESNASREALSVACDTYRKLNSPRDIVFFYLVASRLMREAPSVYGDLLTESSDVYLERAFDLMERYPTLAPRAELLDSILGRRP